MRLQPFHFFSHGAHFVFEFGDLGARFGCILGEERCCFGQGEGVECIPDFVPVAGIRVRVGVMGVRKVGGSMRRAEEGLAERGKKVVLVWAEEIG